MAGALAEWAAKAAHHLSPGRGGEERARPRHIAIIMDGNGRWASARGMPRAFGHSAGVQALRNTVEAAGDLGIEVLTVYAFSTENWRRPPDEIEALFGLLRGFIRSDLTRLDRAGVRVRVLGEREGVPEDILALMDQAEKQTETNQVMTLVIAFNYGGQAEIARATQEIARQAAAGLIDPASIGPETITQFLPSRDWPNPDLVIRTSGEQRLSNFLIWQSAYAEFLVFDTLWPDFGRAQLEEALAVFAQRNRRYGGL
ncbi:ditrans,polycis-undecaprenyl-diphosphate synthase ((2E,6E)-farnesyl-diphosphate specific) [Candidatus Phycosocius bacilliformis]|uniref:Isoprenyl transferase n=1 Tax=Candidatus Phycosocius bacilliformis TaxID=1445552 RepID=A0A2P2EE75_9PROT|nr:isoprenyl transferase [Candidatus Phycosocius bacilliformis]GBF59356.1 ditrans,polycis-undecaprenyl-diphosphate synthase ((2E,6E)-farnesyl-diphosphate specific) [Candidatus Phycosocius bacilliformis]